MVDGLDADDLGLERRMLFLHVLDQLVLDVVMPRLGVPSAALRIRARAPDLPIILTSGYDAAATVALSSLPNARVELRDAEAVLDLGLELARACGGGSGSGAPHPIRST